MSGSGVDCTEAARKSYTIWHEAPVASVLVHVFDTGAHVAFSVPSRLPQSVSTIVPFSRFGLSAEPVFVTVIVHRMSSDAFRASPAAGNLAKSSQTFSTSTPGWNRFTLCPSEALSAFPNPSTVQATDAVFTSGSGSPATTVRVMFRTALPPGARFTLAFGTVSRLSVIVHVRFGVSAELVFVTVIV